MQEKLIQTSHVFYHENHYHSKDKLRDFLESQLLQELCSKYPDTNIVLGWDGTLLRLIRERWDEQKPFLGVNFGRRWSLMVNIEDLEKPLSPQTFPLLIADVKIDDTTLTWQAFNEVTIKSTGWRSIEMNIHASERDFSWIGDGCMIATPCGSSGYNKAAWGPLLDSGSGDFVITPLVIFEPEKAKSLVIWDDSRVHIDIPNERSRPTSIYLDSEPLVEHSTSPLSLTIKKSDQTITLLRP